MSVFFNKDSVFAPIDPKSSSGKALPWVNLVSFVLVVIINAISSVGVLSDYAIGDVSDLYNTLLTPAGYAFSIWGLIYFALAVFAIWNLIAGVRNNILVFDKIGYLFALSCVLNACWIMMFVQGKPVAWVWVSSVLLFGLVASLIAIIVRTNAWNRAFVDTHVSVRSSSTKQGDEPHIEVEPLSMDGKAFSAANTLVTYFAVDFAFSVYAGWTTAASILNVCCALIGSGFYGGAVTQDAWAIIILTIAALIYLIWVIKHGNWAYGAVFTWAALAIANNAPSCAVRVVNFTDPDGCDRVKSAATVLAIIVAVAAAARLSLAIWRLVQKDNEARDSFLLRIGKVSHGTF